MANQHTISDEESQLRRRARRRLIGAITLVTAMVVALPMVLDGESRQYGQDIAINIPSPDSSGDVVSRAVPAPVQAKPTPATPDTQAEKAVPAQVSAQPKTPQAALPAPPAKAEELVPAAAVPAEPVPAAKEPSPQPKHKDEKPDVGTSKQESVPYVIQLGAFANLANAKARQSKLMALKIKFYTETVKAASGDKLRVRAGPYSSRQEAERVQAKLKAAGILDGVVAEKK